MMGDNCILGMRRPKERTSKRRGLPWQEHHDFAWAGSSTASDKELSAAHLKGNPFFCNLSQRAQDALLLKLCELEVPKSVLTDSFVTLEPLDEGSWGPRLHIASPHHTY